jgi:hypothetical protein
MLLKEVQVDDIIILLYQGTEKIDLEKLTRKWFYLPKVWLAWYKTKDKSNMH